MASFITQDLQKILEKFGEGCSDLSWTLTSEKGQYSLCFKWNVSPCDSQNNTGEKEVISVTLPENKQTNKTHTVLANNQSTRRHTPNQAFGSHYHQKPVPRHQWRTPVRKHKCPSTIKRDQARRAYWLENKRLQKIDLTDIQTEIPVTSIPGTPPSVLEKASQNTPEPVSNDPISVTPTPETVAQITPDLISINPDITNEVLDISRILTPKTVPPKINTLSHGHTEVDTEISFKKIQNKLPEIDIGTFDVEEFIQELDQFTSTPVVQPKSFTSTHSSQPISVDTATKEIPAHSCLTQTELDFDDNHTDLSEGTDLSEVEILENSFTQIEDILIREAINYVECCITQELVNSAQNIETNNQIDIEATTDTVFNNTTNNLIDEALENVALENNYEQALKFLFLGCANIDSLAFFDEIDNARISKSVQTGILYFKNKCTNVQKFLNDHKFTDLFYSPDIYGAYIHPLSKPFIEESHNSIEGWSLSKKEKRQINKRKEQSRKNLLIIIDCIKVGIRSIGFEEDVEWEAVTYSSILRNCYKKLQSL